MPKRLAHKPSRKHGTEQVQAVSASMRDARTGLEERAPASSPEILARIDSAEEQIAAGTMTPLDDVLEELCPKHP